MGKEGRLCLDNELAGWYTADGLADCHQGLAEREKVYYPNHQRKGVIEFFLISVS
jgi:hypothetical protein